MNSNLLLILLFILLLFIVCQYLNVRERFVDFSNDPLLSSLDTMKQQVSNIDFQETFRNHPEPSKTYENLSKPVQICPKHVKTYQSLSKPLKNCLRNLINCFVNSCINSFLEL